MILAHKSHTLYISGISKGSPARTPTIDADDDELPSITTMGHSISTLSSIAVIDDDDDDFEDIELYSNDLYYIHSHQNNTKLTKTYFQ